MSPSYSEPEDNLCRLRSGSLCKAKYWLSFFVRKQKPAALRKGGSNLSRILENGKVIAESGSRIDDANITGISISDVIGAGPEVAQA